MPRNGNDFRERDERVDRGEILALNVWYRSPLWQDDHLLGELKELSNDEISWCGRALGYAREIPDTGDRGSLGGLWRSSRTSGRCATCKRKQEEFDASFHPTVY